MKLKEITPAEFVCQSCQQCPAVFETDNNSYLIVGKILPASAVEQLKGRIGADEFVVEVLLEEPEHRVACVRWSETSGGEWYKSQTYGRYAGSTLVGVDLLPVFERHA